jgi:hypothetical protein
MPGGSLKKRIAETIVEKSFVVMGLSPPFEMFRFYSTI